MSKFKQALADEGRDYMLQKFAEERAEELIGSYWHEYLKTGRIGDFDLGENGLERAALLSGIGDIRTVLLEHIKREVIVAANNPGLSREWRLQVLGYGSAWD